MFLFFNTIQNECSLHLEVTPVMRNVWVCRVTGTIFSQVSFHLSRFGFLGLAGDRYLAIVHPLKYRDWGTTKNGWIAVLIFLTIAVIVNTPYSMYTYVHETGRKSTPLHLPFVTKLLLCPDFLMGAVFAK